MSNLSSETRAGKRRDIPRKDSVQTSLAVTKCWMASPHPPLRILTPIYRSRSAQCRSEGMNRVKCQRHVLPHDPFKCFGGFAHRPNLDRGPIMRTRSNCCYCPSSQDNCVSSYEAD